MAQDAPATGERWLRVGVLINSGSVVGGYLLRHLDERVGVSVLFCSRSEAHAGRWSRLKKQNRRQGLFRTVDRHLGRLYLKLTLARRERAELARLIDVGAMLAPPPAHIRVCHVPSVASREMEEALRAADLDVLCVMCAEMLPGRLLSIPREAVIGHHPGITPYYRGTWPTFWALANGEPEMVGSSVFIMEEKADTGPVIYQEAVEIDYGRDTLLSLGLRCYKKSAELMARAVEDLRAGRLSSRRIVADRARTYYSMPGLVEYFVHRRRAQAMLQHGPRGTASEAWRAGAHPND